VQTFCERGIEPLGSIKCCETTEWLHNLWPLEWYSDPQLISCDVRTSQETHLHASTACYWDSFTFLYVGDVRTSQEAQTSTACYRDSFTCLYVGDVRTSQEAQTSTACYGDSFTFLYVGDVRTSQEA
jgi:hypothetical protein